MGNIKSIDSINDLRKILSDSSGIDLEKITNETVINTLELDSLDKAELIISIEEAEEKYKVKIDDDEADSLISKTVQQAYDYLKQKRQY